MRTERRSCPQPPRENERKELSSRGPVRQARAIRLVQSRATPEGRALVEADAAERDSPVGRAVRAGRPYPTVQGRGEERPRAWRRNPEKPATRCSASRARLSRESRNRGVRARAYGRDPRGRSRRPLAQRPGGEPFRDDRQTSEGREPPPPTIRYCRDERLRRRRGRERPRDLEVECGGVRPSPPVAPTNRPRLQPHAAHPGRAARKRTSGSRTVPLRSRNRAGFNTVSYADRKRVQWRPRARRTDRRDDVVPWATGVGATRRSVVNEAAGREGGRRNAAVNSASHPRGDWTCRGTGFEPVGCSTGSFGGAGLSGSPDVVVATCVLSALANASA